MANSSFPLDERIRIWSGDVSLAARLTRVTPSAPLLIMAHGFAGDKDEKGLFIAARDFFAGKGFSVLRFDFRGCGESEGDFRNVRLDHLAKDLSAVIKHAHLKYREANSIGLVSFSLAAGVAILANSDLVGAHIFWSPAIYTDRDMAIRYETDQIINDQIARNGWFEKSGLHVGKHFLDDLGSKQIEQSIPRFRRSVLIIHGMDDQRIPATSSESLMRQLSASSRLILIPKADHSFRSHPNQREWLYSATTAWLSNRIRKITHDKHFDQAHLFDSDNGSSFSSTARI